MKKRLLKQIVSSISNNFDTKKILKNPGLLPIKGENKDYNKPKIWTKNSKNSEFAVL